MDKKYTYEEICSLLCEGCSKSLQLVRVDSKWIHTVNGVDVPCRADEWKNKVFQEKRAQDV